MLAAVRSRLAATSSRSAAVARQQQARWYMTMSPDSHLGQHAAHTEFDHDAGDWVPKEVSIHDRRQAQLSESQKAAARLSDYDGKSEQYTSGSVEPAAYAAVESPEQIAAADQAMQRAESHRD